MPTIRPKKGAHPADPGEIEAKPLRGKADKFALHGKRLLSDFPLYILYERHVGDIPDRVAGGKAKVPGLVGWSVTLQWFTFGIEAEFKVYRSKRELVVTINGVEVGRYAARTADGLLPAPPATSPATASVAPADTVETPTSTPRKARAGTRRPAAPKPATPNPTRDEEEWDEWP